MRKKTLQHCVDLAAKNNGLCLSTVYINADSKMLWECSAGHQWETSSSSIQQGTWCRRCHQISTIINIDDCHLLAKANNAQCLSTKCAGAKSKVRWKCWCGYVWTSSYKSAKGGRWCSNCAGNTHNTLDDCHKLAAKNNGFCLSETYFNTKVKLKWKCSKNHIWMAHYGSVFSMGSWCGRCNNSKTEEKVRSIFADIFRTEFPTKRPKWLINPKTGKSLELDGYNRGIKLAFEYDGEQHYKPVDAWGGASALKELQQRDALKDKICTDKGVNLIRIPYTKKNKLEEYILDQIEIKGIKIK